MGYVLDLDALARINFLEKGRIPDINALKAVSFMVELASMTYEQGRQGKTFDMGHGIPVKWTDA